MHEPNLGGGGFGCPVREHPGHLHDQARPFRVQRQLAVLGDHPDWDTTDPPDSASVPHVQQPLLLAGLRGAVHSNCPSHSVLAARQAGREPRAVRP